MSLFSEFLYGAGIGAGMRVGTYIAGHGARKRAKKAAKAAEKQARRAEREAAIAAAADYDRRIVAEAQAKVPEEGRRLQAQRARIRQLERQEAFNKAMRDGLEARRRAGRRQLVDDLVAAQTEYARRQGPVDGLDTAELPPVAARRAMPPRQSYEDVRRVHLDAYGLRDVRLP